VGTKTRKELVESLPKNKEDFDNLTKSVELLHEFDKFVKGEISPREYTAKIIGVGTKTRKELVESLPKYSEFRSRVDKFSNDTFFKADDTSNKFKHIDTYLRNVFSPYEEGFERSGVV